MSPEDEYEIDKLIASAHVERQVITAEEDCRAWMGRADEAQKLALERRYEIGRLNRRLARCYWLIGGLIAATGLGWYMAYLLWAEVR